MTVQCPTLSDALVIADDPQLAAQLSCILAAPHTYVSVLDAPRLQRPDADAEVIRRGNAAARSRASRFILAGLDDTACDAMARVIPREKSMYIRSSADLLAVTRARRMNEEPLSWGTDKIGIGLLKALRKRQPIVFSQLPSPRETVPPKSNHLVVCEDGDELAQVIAANYAFAMGAGLHLISSTPRLESEQLLERFYGIYENRDRSPAEILDELRHELRVLAGPIPVPAGGSITFIAHYLPYGFAFPEVPATHLFLYPDLGLSVVHGLAAEQADRSRVRVATLVNPETTSAPEIDAAVKILASRGFFVRAYQGQRADVGTITDMIELFPYDLVLIATHCGDASGLRWTYEFRDSEGLERRLVVDIALGFGATGTTEFIDVTQFIRFVSLDGVAWDDPEKKAKIRAGSAILDFMERMKTDPDFKPVKKDTIPRVIGSAALKMADHNLIAVPRSLANEGTPIIINNACVSWHRLAASFSFGGARAYIGMLIPITSMEAESVIERTLGRHFGKPLAVALLAAQRDAYGQGARRPYVVVGAFPQRLRPSIGDAPRHIVRRLMRGLVSWRKYLAGVDPKDEPRKRRVEAHVRFFERELEWFRKEWGLRVAPTPSANNQS